MVKLPDRLPKSVQKIYDAYEAKQGDPRREHLGASVIGKQCNRHLWYLFRWANPEVFDGRILRLFDTGHREEARIAGDLIAAGVNLQTFDPETGRQWLFSWLGGHFGGSCDGIGDGFPEAPKTLHVFEAKSVNKKWLATLKKKGVKESKPEHWTQMQTYMRGANDRGMNIKRAIYFSGCKDNDELYVERIKYDKVATDAVLNKARMVVFSQVPLEKIADDPSSHLCVFCPHKSICHFEAVGDLKRNCRTCLASTPLEDGTWWCDEYETELTLEEQRAGCKSHLFIPGLIPWKVEDADPAKRQVTYRRPDGSLAVDGDCELKGKT